MVLLVCALLASPPALTLDAALSEARAANARLPVAALELRANEEQVRSARGQLLPKLGLQGDLQIAPRRFGYSASGTPVGEERLQLQATESLYEGGALRAKVRGAEAQVSVSRAAVRIAEKDLDRDVRMRFSEVSKNQENVRLLEEGLARLRSYLLTIRQRQAGGEGLQADVLKTEARLASEEADSADAARLLRGSEMELADLVGRDPAEPLALAQLPPPAPPGEPIADRSWEQAPELARGAALIALAEANAEAALAGRRPRVQLGADVGLLGPGFASDLPAGGLSQRLRDDLGASLTLTFSWPLLDFGVYSGDRGQARALAEQARRQAVVLSREARLRFGQAREDLERWHREAGLRAKAVPLSRDAYLSAESLYRGGGGTALEVLDAFGNLLSASKAYAEAIFSFRVAQAEAIRWSTP